MSIIGYARVSTVGQPLEVQLAQLKAAKADKIFQEKVSGVKRDRPQLLAMLDYVREGDTVVVSKLDRIARSTKHLLEIVEQLQGKCVAFKVLNIDLDTSTPTGELMLTVLAGIAQFERGMMLERQAEGIAKAKEDGRYTGRKPTAQAKTKEVLELLQQGATKKATAEKLGIGIASVYRIAGAQKAAR